MEQMIKYFMEHESELKAILEGKASFAFKLSPEQGLRIIQEVYNGVIRPVSSFWG